MHRVRQFALCLALLAAFPALAARAQTSGADASLRLPDAAWPASHDPIEETAIAPSNADSSRLNPFASAPFHTMRYAPTLRSGTLQTTAFKANESGDPVLLAWLGSTYSGQDGAQRMLDDAISSMQARGFAAQPCYLEDEPGCRLYAIPLFVSGGMLHAIYAVWSRGSVLGEALLLTGFATTAHSPDVIGQSVATLLRAGGDMVAAASPDASPSGAPPQSVAPTITVDAVTVLHDVRGALKRTGRLSLHETGSFQATFHVSAIGAYSPAGKLSVFFPQASFSLLKGSQILFEGAATLAVSPGGTPYFDSTGTVDKKTGLGTLQARFTLILGGSSAVRSVRITVVRPH